MIQRTNRAIWAVVVWAAGLGLPAQAATVPMSSLVEAGLTLPQWRMATSQGKKTTRRKPKKQADPERMPSGESVTARERRLLRECKGRPNAGACLGYAS
jgi:hypothetical protein